MRSRITLCIILHYGSEDDTNTCIESLKEENSLEIVVSDNDPAQTYEIPQRYKSVVRVIRTGGAAGFSEGNNIAATAFLTDKHDSVFILNNDTVVAKGAVSLLRDALFADAVGAVGPCMPYASSPENIWACGGFIDKRSLAIGGLQPKSKTSYEVDYLPGAAIFCRSEVWKKIGGLPEKYFLAYEEAEFALEIKRLGLKILAVPAAIVLHKVGMSSQVKPEYFYNSVRNRIIFAKYLYGTRTGFLYGVLWTARSMSAPKLKLVFVRIKLWTEAVIDEMRGLALDRRTLLYIAASYRTQEF